MKKKPTRLAAVCFIALCALLYVLSVSAQDLCKVYGTVYQQVQEVPTPQPKSGVAFDIYDVRLSGRLLPLWEQRKKSASNGRIVFYLPKCATARIKADIGGFESSKGALVQIPCDQDSVALDSLQALAILVITPSVGAHFADSLRTEDGRWDADCWLNATGKIDTTCIDFTQWAAYVFNHSAGGGGGDGDITAVTAGDGLKGGATTGAATLHVNLQVLSNGLEIVSDSLRTKSTVSLLGQTIESVEITDGTITNSDINTSAAIVETKLLFLTNDGSRHDHVVADLTNINAGTNLTADLEEEVHASEHENGGADEISVAGLSGLLADGQTPLAHKTSHQDGGSDELSVTGLSGLLADVQKVTIEEADANPTVNAMKVQFDQADGFTVTDETGGQVQIDLSGMPEALIAFAANDGSRHDHVVADLTNVNAGTNLTADLEEEAHASEHQDGGADEISVTGLSGLLADVQKVTVEEADANPTVNATKIQFDQADGFTVTDETGGQVQIDLNSVPETLIAFAANDGSRHDHVVADLTNVNAGTNLTADLEEEAHASEHQNGGADEISVAGLSGLLADAQSVIVRKNSGANVGTRTRLNLIEGANVTLTIADDGTDGEVDVTIAASGGGGSLTVEEADNIPSVVATVVQFDQADGFTVTDEGSGQVQIDLSGVPEALIAFAANDGSRHDHVVADLTNVNAGTNLTADLEEEAHASEHQDGGTDEISVTGLSGLLADVQKVTVEEADANPTVNATKVQFDQADGFTVTDETGGQVQIDLNGIPEARITFATNDGTRHDHVVADLTNVNAGTNLTADLEEESHAAEHENGGADEISVAGLSGLLADAQSVIVRKNSGANVGTRTRLNFIEGANITLTVADDGTDGEVDVTIASTGGTSSWSALTAPTAATSFVSDGISETASFDFQSAFTTGNQFTIKQTTGNPSGGTLFAVQAGDANVSPMMLIENTAAVSIGIGLQIVAATSGVLTTAIDASDIEIGTALNAGDNQIAINGFGEKWLPAGALINKAGDLTVATGLFQDFENTNDNGWDYYEFSASADNYLIADFGPMPLNWDGLTAPKIRIVSYSTTAHASNTADFECAAKYVLPGIDAMTGAFGSFTSNGKVIYDVANEEQILTLSPTPGGLAGAGAHFIVLLRRDGDDATNDTATGTSRVTWIGLQYKTNEVLEMTSW